MLGALLPVAATAATCFAVDDDSGRIVVFDRDPPVSIRYNTTITYNAAPLPAERIEGAYFDSVNNRYYVVIQDVPNYFGYVDPFTAVFVRISPAGTGMGTTVLPSAKVVGTDINQDAISGLTRNPVTNRWYVIDKNGYLFELNASTGVYVPGSFGGNDYIRVAGPTGTFYTNVEDLAFDASGELFVIRNDPGAEQLLRNVSLITGRATATANTGIDEAEGLALTNGSMRLIVGGGGGVNVRNFYGLDTTTGAVSLIFNLPNASTNTADYEAQGCNDSYLRADLALTKTVTPSVVAPGGTLTYTLVLVNQGIDPAYRVQVTDALDGGQTVVSSTIGSSCTVCSFDSGTGVWTVDKIDIGQRRTLTLVVSTTGVTPNTFVNNRAQVTQSCDWPTGACVSLVDTDSTPNNKSGAWSATEDDEAVASALVTIQPAVTKAFTPVSGLAGETSTLLISLVNGNTVSAATLTAAFSDSYPAGMSNAATPAGTTSCASGVVTAVAGGSSVSLASGARIPAGGSCTISVVVTAVAVGTYSNTVSVGVLTVTVAGVTLSNVVGFTATYQVFPTNVAVIKDFTPDAIAPGSTSTLKITLSNPTSVTATLTNVFTDTYPVGLVNAATPAAATNCLGSGGPTASAGLGTVTLPVTRAIPPRSSCTLTVVVTSSTKGTYDNVIAAASLNTTAGYNYAAASAVLLVDAPSVYKEFQPSSIQTGGTALLVIRFINPLATNATITATFTDTYPTGIVNAATPAATDDCAGGNVSATAARGTVTMPVGTVIPAFSSCQLTVVVAGVTGTTTGTFVNSVPIGSLTTTLGSNSIAATATLTISTLVNLTVTKIVSTASGTPSQTLSYTVTVGNLGPNTVTSAAFSDVLSGLSLVGSVTYTFVAPGTGTVSALTTTTTTISANITLSPGTGYFRFTFSAVPTSYNGYVTNTAAIQPPVGATDSNMANNTATVATYINPYAFLAITKTNGVSSVVSGGTTTYTITASNAGLSDASGAVVKDTPSAGLSCTSVSCSPAGGASCGTVTVGALAGGHPIPTFPSGSTLTFTLTCNVL